MKRPTCKWKGQTDACEESTGGAGSPISRMPQKTKGGLQPTRHAFSTVRHNSAKGIDNILIEMKLDNKSDYTINFTRKALNTISKYANLDKPQEVKMFLALHKASDGYKRNLLHSLQQVLQILRYCMEYAKI